MDTVASLIQNITQQLRSETVRVPFTKNQCVRLILDYDEGRTVPEGTPSREELATILVDSIRALIYKVSNRFSINSIDTADDLYQECMRHIFVKLNKFDPKKSSFNTWASGVASNYLISCWRSGRKHRERLTTYDPMTDNRNASVERDCVLANDMREIVKKIIVAHPAEKAIVLAIFGDPYSDAFMLPDKINFKASARAIGIDSQKVQLFFSRVVQPAFKRAFV